MSAEAQSQPSRHRQAELDPALVARAARGDAAAFSQIYARTVTRVQRYVRTIIWNAWDAEDVTQDVFIKVIKGLPRYDAQTADFSCWMLRVARNAAIDHLRRRASEPTCAALDRDPSSEDVAARSGALRDALESLTVSQRQILMLRALGGYTPTEVATGTGCSRGAINVQYHRARLTARDHLVAMSAGPCTQSAERCP
jgi:RNA polymerase sigma-70 factor (ECF subfamily)